MYGIVLIVMFVKTKCVVKLGVCLQGGSDDEQYIECLVSKQLLIHKLPPILILHMKRFHLGVRVTKNNNHITFPDMLNVAQYCSSNISVSSHVQCT